VAFLSVAGTFLTVAWEELWFRSIILNYCKQSLPVPVIAAVVGITFMLAHIMNPKISLWQEGPALFLAGFLLALLYLIFRSIWVPLGVHLGNNLSGSFYTYHSTSVFGEDGYASAAVLATVILAFLLYYRRSA
jgi:hypothetical protein